MSSDRRVRNCSAVADEVQPYLTLDRSRGVAVLKDNLLVDLELEVDRYASDTGIGIRDPGPDDEVFLDEGGVVDPAGEE